jgi:hypothetical protein
LTAQGIDGDPLDLLDKFICYRFKLLQEGGDRAMSNGYRRFAGRAWSN